MAAHLTLVPQVAAEPAPAPRMLDTADVVRLLEQLTGRRRDAEVTSAPLRVVR
jgi:hypothetical protein